MAQTPTFHECTRDGWHINNFRRLQTNNPSLEACVRLRISRLNASTQRSIRKQLETRRFEANSGLAWRATDIIAKQAGLAMMAKVRHMIELIPDLLPEAVRKPLHALIVDALVHSEMRGQAAVSSGHPVSRHAESRSHGYRVALHLLEGTPDSALSARPDDAPYDYEYRSQCLFFVPRNAPETTVRGVRLAIDPYGTDKKNRAWITQVCTHIMAGLFEDPAQQQAQARALELLHRGAAGDPLDLHPNDTDYVPNGHFSYSGDKIDMHPMQHHRHLVYGARFERTRTRKRDALTLGPGRRLVRVLSVPVTPMTP